MSQHPEIFTLAGFNLQNFNATLKKKFKGASVTSVDYDQLLPYLMELGDGEEKGELCICWITLQDIFQATSSGINLSELLLKLEHSFQYSIVILPAVDNTAFNMFQGNEIRNQVYEFNLNVSKNSDPSKMSVLDPTPWFLEQGKSFLSSKLWYLSKTPYHINVFKLAAATCGSVWDAWRGKSKKLLILDLDDTLWGGLVGDDGWQNLKIGGHDPIGEAFAHFQHWIKNIKESGVILAICSKNYEENALEVFEKHNGMLLEKGDFVTWRINWEDKAANIADIVEELNIGMDSVVFLDDSPFERNRIRTALPEVFVPELPEDKLEYPVFIRGLQCFNRVEITQEDKNRTQLYKEEQKRGGSKASFTSVDDWIESLNIKVNFEALSEGNLLRAEQLLNKTNQMNLRTRRLSKEQLLDWANGKDHWFFVVHVQDIFGDNGITGLLGYHQKSDGEYFIDDFVMSCRVMGRGIEDQMVDYLREQTQGAKLMVELLPTEKNKPMLEFFNKYENHDVVKFRVKEQTS